MLVRPLIARVHRSHSTGQPREELESYGYGYGVGVGVVRDADEMNKKMKMKKGFVEF